MSLGYLFEITSARIVYSFTILSKKSFATKEALRAPSPTKQGISLLYLVKPSTQVTIALYQLGKGRSVIKSVLQDINLPFRTSNHYNKLV